MSLSALKQNQKFSSVYFITIKTINGIHIFKRKEYFDIILSSLEYCQKSKGLLIWAYTIIINHLHLVFKIKSGFNAHETIGDFKKFTANQILKQLKKDNEFEILKKLRYTTIQNKKQKHKIWKSSCYPRAIISEKFLTQKIDYTDFNAVRHGIINDIEKYPHTSYHNHYCNHFVLLKIDSIEF